MSLGGAEGSQGRRQRRGCGCVDGPDGMRVSRAPRARPILVFFVREDEKPVAHGWLIEAGLTASYCPTSGRQSMRLGSLVRHPMLFPFRNFATARVPEIPDETPVALAGADLPPREVSPVIGQYAGNTEVTVFRPRAENPGGSPGIRPPTVVQGIRRQTVLVSGRGASWVPKKGDAVRASPSTYSLHRCFRTLGGRVRGRGPEPGVGHAAGDRGQGRHPDIGEHKPGVQQQ